MTKGTLNGAWSIFEAFEKGQGPAAGQGRIDPAPEMFAGTIAANRDARHWTMATARAFPPTVTDDLRPIAVFLHWHQESKAALFSAKHRWVYR